MKAKADEESAKFEAEKKREKRRQKRLRKKQAKQEGLTTLTDNPSGVAPAE